MRDRLLIVGASGRAAAASAIRAGFDPFVLDLFADADTRRLCPVLKCDPADYPHGFIPLAKSAPPGPWMYTGGLENYPEVVAAISEERQLHGNGPERVKACRDPFRLGAAVRAVGGRFPESLPAGTTPPGGGRWLRKAVASAGGMHVRFAGAGDFDPAAANDQWYLQQFIDGQPVSAIFCEEAGDTWLFGLTVQLAGCDWLHAPPFAYAGNITARHRERAGRLLPALTITREFDLWHAWGVDFIDTGRGIPYTLEVNPRYTAGVEVLEYATRRVFLGAVGATPVAKSVVGKAIYYAPHALTFPGSGPWDESLARCTDVWKRPDFADIPDPGAAIERGQPVMTMLAEATTEGECEAELRRRAAELDTLFGMPPGEPT